jgi:hypothetical protein
MTAVVGALMTRRVHEESSGGQGTWNGNETYLRVGVLWWLGWVAGWTLRKDQSVDRHQQPSFQGSYWVVQYMHVLLGTSS